MLFQQKPQMEWLPAHSDVEKTSALSFVVAETYNASSRLEILEQTTHHGGTNGRYFPGVKLYIMIKTISSPHAVYADHGEVL